MRKKQQELITTTEVAKLLNRDARTIQRQAAAGEVPFVSKLPGTTGAFLFNRAEIEELVAAQSVPALAEGGDAS